MLLSANSAMPAAINDQSLNEQAKTIWNRERRNLDKLVARVKAAEDLNAWRTEFAPLSQEIGVLAKTFGFGPTYSVFEIHCPTALQGQGASWYQDNDEVSNPYFGSTMLRCADRVEQLGNATSATPTGHDPHANHAHH